MWRLCIDTGGTFTDCVAIAPDGSRRRAKVLSSAALRGRVTALRRGDDPEGARDRPESQDRRARDATLEVTLAPPPPLGAVVGMTLRVDAACVGVVTAYGGESLAVRLDDIAAPLSIGDLVELRADEEAPILAARILTATPFGGALPPMTMRLATTRGTNALLERRTARVALVTTRGFADLHRIRDQRRAALFDLAIVRPPSLASVVIEVAERVGADGTILEPLVEKEIKRVIESLRCSGAEAVAVALLHAWIEPAHERQLVEALRAAGLRHVFRSGTDHPMLGFLPRLERCLVDAALGPIVEAYLQRVEAALDQRDAPDGRQGHDQAAAHDARDHHARHQDARHQDARHQDARHQGVRSTGPLLVMTSAGGLVSSRRFLPSSGLLSGPAGGVAGAARAAGHSRVEGGEGVTRVLAFDMGGTSTDVARLDGGLGSAALNQQSLQHTIGHTIRHTHRVGAVEIAAPALAIESVAAGGGSILDFDGVLYTVGPASAGADPGPACHGRGGPLTVTDADLLLGRLDPGRLGIPIDRDAALRAAAALAARSGVAGAAGAVTRSPSRPRDAIAAMLQRLVDLADERMADAIAAISIRQGVDCAAYTIVAFGGCGGLHACTVAERLGIERVLLPADAGVLSAVGLEASTLERRASAPVLAPLEHCEAHTSHEPTEPRERSVDTPPLALEAPMRRARDAACTALIEDGAVSVPHVTYSLELRLVGQESTIDLAVHPDDSARRIAERFREAYHTLYGHEAPRRGIEVVNVHALALAPLDDAARSVAQGEDARPDQTRGGDAPERDVATSDDQTECWTAGAWYRARVVDVEAWIAACDRDSEASRTLVGPALLRQAHGSAWIPPEWQGELEGGCTSAAGRGSVLLRRVSSSTTATTRSARVRADGAMPREIVAARLGSIAESMGELLRRTAISVNVKERLDFSCGILDDSGRLVVNAAHVPVHLGALGPCVRAVVAHRSRERAPAPGDVYLTNHPAFGGSHLPDLTVITPVFLRATLPSDQSMRPRHERAGANGNVLVGYVASRAHHAELGGIRPGSMPTDARSLAEEAVVIPPMLLVDQGRPRWELIESMLRDDRDGRHPSRAVEENLADLRAAVAANALGAAQLAALASELEPTPESRTELGTESRLESSPRSERGERFRARLAELHEHARLLAARAIVSLPDRRIEAFDRLDDGAPLAVNFERSGTRLRVDFTGTGAVGPGPLNATTAIVRSAVMYVLRVLLEGDPPLNEGLLADVSVHVPRGMLDPFFPDDPGRCPPVGAGNTELSQRLVDLMLRALGRQAGSQGTMNNVVFGSDGEVGVDRNMRDMRGMRAMAGGRPFGCYETIGGGTGAGPGFDGAEGVHSHMTNTRITDVEVLEHRYPVRIERFSLREGSGGTGRFHGGEGLLRAYRFLAPVSLSVLSQRRTAAPPGLLGGAPGTPGRNTLLRADGSTVDLGSAASIAVERGDLLTIETPGGGGFGAKL